MARRWHGSPWRAMLVSALLVGPVVGSCTTDGGRAADTSSSTSIPMASCEQPVIVFFEPRISDDELADAGATLEALDGVAEVDVLDQAEAFAEAQRLFADDPSTLRLLDEDTTPPHVRVRLTDASMAGEVAREAEALPLVRTVTVASPPSDAIVAALGAEAVERWCGEAD